MKTHEISDKENHSALQMAREIEKKYTEKMLKGRGAEMEKVVTSCGAGAE
jgi:hypothetical protein